MLGTDRRGRGDPGEGGRIRRPVPPCGLAPGSTTLRGRRILATVAVVATVAATAVGMSSPAGAVQTEQAAIVSAVPAAWTPNVLNGKVEAIAQVGNTIVIGGTFTSIQSPVAGSPVLTRNRIAAFDATTGAISTSFAPSMAARSPRSSRPATAPRCSSAASSPSRHRRREQGRPADRRDRRPGRRLQGRHRQRRGPRPALCFRFPRAAPSDAMRNHLAAQIQQ